MTNNIVEVFPKCSPVLGSFDLDRAQKEDPHISAGEGRSIAYQALMQLLGEQLINIINHLNILHFLLRSSHHSGGLCSAGFNNGNINVLHQAL